jgi:polyhydroxyalkanoate synthesis regulator phasin
MITDQELFDAPTGKPAKQIASLHERRLALQRRLREALIARDTAHAEHDRLDEQVKTTQARALALDQPANTKRDTTRLGQVADQAADHDRTVEALGAAIAAIEAEIRERAQAACDELLDEAVAEHEQAREQVTEALQSLAAAQGRARAAYTAAQAVAANAGVLHITARMRDVPNVERIVRGGGLEPLIPHDRDRIAA